MTYVLEALQALISPMCLALVLVGIIAGVVFGAVPGLGGGLLTSLSFP